MIKKINNSFIRNKYILTLAKNIFISFKTYGSLNTPKYSIHNLEVIYISAVIKQFDNAGFHQSKFCSQNIGISATIHRLIRFRGPGPQ